MPTTRSSLWPSKETVYASQQDLLLAVSLAAAAAGYGPLRPSPQKDKPHRVRYRCACKHTLIRGRAVQAAVLDGPWKVVEVVEEHLPSSAHTQHELFGIAEKQTVRLASFSQRLVLTVLLRRREETFPLLPAISSRCELSSMRKATCARQRGGQGAVFSSNTRQGAASSRCVALTRDAISSSSLRSRRQRLRSRSSASRSAASILAPRSTK